jgi:hypothetical protein
MNFRFAPIGGAQDATLGFLRDRPKQLRAFAVGLLQRQPSISRGSRVSHCQLQIDMKRRFKLTRMNLFRMRSTVAVDPSSSQGFAASA